MPRRLLALLTVAALAAAACGGSSEEPDTAERGGDEAQSASTVEIKALDFSFEPSEVTVDAGDSVEVEVSNGGSVAHTFTATDAAVDVTVEPGATATAVFDAREDATIEFVCKFHSDEMTGTITVGAGGGGAGGGGGGDSESDDFDY